MLLNKETLPQRIYNGTPYLVLFQTPDYTQQYKEVVRFLKDGQLSPRVVTAGVAKANKNSPGPTRSAYKLILIPQTEVALALEYLQDFTLSGNAEKVQISDGEIG